MKRIDANNIYRSFSRNLAIAGLIGGGIGAIITLLDNIANRVNLLNGMFNSIMLGIALGASIYGLTAVFNFQRNNTKDERSHNASLRLMKEQFETSKELVPIADVTTHKSVTTEEKTFTVPVNREELVVEKKSYNAEGHTDNEHTEVMRIPISEEQIKIVKHPVKLEDVSIHREQHQEIEHFEDVLKKEVVRIEVMGDARIVDIGSEDV